MVVRTTRTLLALLLVQSSCEWRPAWDSNPHHGPHVFVHTTLGSANSRLHVGHVAYLPPVTAIYPLIKLYRGHYTDNYTEDIHPLIKLYRGYYADSYAEVIMQLYTSHFTDIYTEAIIQTFIQRPSYS